MSQTITIRAAALPPGPAGAIVIYVSEDTEPRGVAAEIWQQTGLDFPRMAAAAGFKGKQGQLLDIVAPNGLEAQRLFVLGSGKMDPDKPASMTAWSDRGGSLAAKLSAAKISSAAVALDGPDCTPEGVAALAAGIKLRLWRFDRYRSRRDEDAAEQSVYISLHVTDPVKTQAVIDDRLAVADGTLLARELVTEPPNILGTDEFAARVHALASLGLEIEVLDEPELRAKGMNAMLAVAKGSARPPHLVVMQWKGGGDAPPIAFVGKGVVFDSGGISIKPGAGMEDMKGDMGGAAAVTGLMQALATRKAKVNAVGVIGLVENMPSGTAYRPGDIIRAMSGTTIEIVNTDAEGRMVLADALWYTQDRFKPRAMVNLATLTGAIGVALGHDHAGLFSNDDELAGRLLNAGYATGEKLWRMPMGPAYDKMIESRFADIKNSGGRVAGSITAAMFLGRFVNSTPWAHLDIAGTAFGVPASETSPAWASGFGVALLDRLVREHYESHD
ncbi:MAG TPA: leucyl aminopeptidase [Devosia sp.]|nr:leucyl aminopeptidase [Devosia sp.]